MRHIQAVDGTRRSSDDGLGRCAALARRDRPGVLSFRGIVLRRALRATAAGLFAGLLLVPAVLTGQNAAWTFDEGPADRPPPGFAFTGRTPGRWLLVRDGANGVVSGGGPGSEGARLAIAEGTSFTDLVVSARLRFPAGAGSAGLAWRYRDEGNYYFAEVDLRAHDVRIYRVAGGTRRRLDDQDDLEIDPAAWHAMKIEHRSTRIRVWIDGVPVVDARDRRNQEPGAIGLWTSGAADAWFDDLRVDLAPDADSGRDRRRD